MQFRTPYPKAESASLPAGVYILPRRPEALDFSCVPRTWVGGSRSLSTAFNLFSFIIPEHERFFIRTLRKTDAGSADHEIVRAFMQQEALHYQVHEEFNDTRTAHGMQVARDLGTIRKAFEAIERRYSLKVRLGMTAFMEHVTAICAQIALGEDSLLGYMHPTMRDLWEWHALEELEHKAVAFDLFQRAGGGYLMRVYSGVLAILADARLFRVLGRRARADRAAARARGELEHAAPTTEQRALRAQIYRLQRRNFWRAVRAGARYFVPGFHPWKTDDSGFIRRAYAKYGERPA